MINEENWDLYSDLVTDDHEQKTESNSELNKLLNEAKSTIESLKTDLKCKEERETTLIQQNEELKKNISALLLTAKSELRRKNLIINDLRDQLEQYEKRSFFNGGYNGGTYRQYSKTEPVKTGRDSSQRAEGQASHSNKRKNTEDLEQNASKRSRISEPVRENKLSASTKKPLSNDRDDGVHSNHTNVSEKNDLRQKIKSRLGESKVIKCEKAVEKSEKSDRKDKIDSDSGLNKSFDLREKLRRRKDSESVIQNEDKTREDNIITAEVDKTNEDKKKTYRDKEDKTIRETTGENKQNPKDGFSLPVSTSKSEPKMNGNFKINEEKSNTVVSMINTTSIDSGSAIENNVLFGVSVGSQNKKDVICANDKSQTQSMQMNQNSINKCISELRKQTDKKIDENVVFENNRPHSHFVTSVPNFSENSEYTIGKSDIVAPIQLNEENASNSDNKILNAYEEESNVKLRDPRRKGRVEVGGKTGAEQYKNSLPSTSKGNRVLTRDPRKQPKHVKTNTKEKIIKSNDEDLEENSPVDFSIEDKDCLLQDSSCLKITTEDGDIEQLINNRENQATDPRKKSQVKLVVDLLPVCYVGNVEMSDMVSNKNESVVSKLQIDIESEKEKEATNIPSSVLSDCDKDDPKVIVSSVKDNLNLCGTASSSNFHQILKDEDRIETSEDSDGSSLKLVIDIATTPQTVSSPTNTCSQSTWDSQTCNNTNSPLPNNDVALKSPDSLAAFEESASYPIPKMPTPLINNPIVSLISSSDIMVALNSDEGLNENVCDMRSKAAMDSDIFHMQTKITNTKDSDVHNGSSIIKVDMSAPGNKVSSQTVDCKKSSENLDTPMDLSIHGVSDKNVIQNDTHVKNSNHVSVSKDIKRSEYSDKLAKLGKDDEGADGERKTQCISRSNKTKHSNGPYSNETKSKKSVNYCKTNSNVTLSPISKDIKIINENKTRHEVKLSSKTEQILHSNKNQINSKSNITNETGTNRKLLTKCRSKQNLKTTNSTQVRKVDDKMEVQDDPCKSTKSKSPSKLPKSNSSKQSPSLIGSGIRKNKEGKVHSLQTAVKSYKQDSYKCDRSFTKIEPKSKEKPAKSYQKNTNSDKKLEESSKQDKNDQKNFSYHRKNEGSFKQDKSRGCKTKGVEKVAACESNFENVSKAEEKFSENIEKQVLFPEVSQIEKIQSEQVSKESIEIEKPKNTLVVKNSREREQALTDVVESMDVTLEETDHNSPDKIRFDGVPKATFDEGKSLKSTTENVVDSDLESQPRNDDFATTGCNGDNEEKSKHILAEDQKGSDKNEKSLISQTPLDDTPLSGGWLARLFSSGNENEFVKRLQKIEEDIEVLKTATLQRNALLATSCDKTPGENVIGLDSKSRCSNERKNSNVRLSKQRGRKPGKARTSRPKTPNMDHIPQEEKKIPLARKRLDCDLVTSSSDVLIENSSNHFVEKTPPKLESDEPITRRTRSSERLRAKKELTLVPETIGEVTSDDRTSIDISTIQQPLVQNEDSVKISNSTEKVTGLDTNCNLVLESTKSRVFTEKDAEITTPFKNQSETLEVVEENDFVVESSVSKSTQQSSSKASNITSETSLATSNTASATVSLLHDLMLSNTSMESLNSSLNSENSIVSIHSADSSSSSTSSQNQIVQKSFTVNETLIECEPNHSDESDSSDDNDTEDEKEMKVDSSFTNTAVQMLKSDLDLSTDSNGSDNSVLETESHGTISNLHKTPKKKEDATFTSSQLSSISPLPSVKCSINIDHEKKTPEKNIASLSPPVSPVTSAWSRISPVPKFVQSQKVNCDSKLLALINLSAHYLQSSGHSLNFDSQCNETVVDTKEQVKESETPVKKNPIISTEKMLVRSSTPRCKPHMKCPTIVDEVKKVEISESVDNMDDCGSSVIKALETSMSNSNKCVNAESVHSKEEMLDKSGSGLLSPIQEANLSKSEDKLKSTSSKPFKKPSIEDFKIFQTSNDTNDDTDDSKEDGEITQDSIDVGDDPEILMDSNSVNFVFDARIDEDDELLKDTEAETSFPKKRGSTPKKSFVIPKRTRSSPRIRDKSRSIHHRKDSRTSNSKGHPRHDDKKISWRERSQSPPSKGRRRLYEPHEKLHGYSSSRRGDMRSNRPDTSCRDRDRGRERTHGRLRHRCDRS